MAEKTEGQEPKPEGQVPPAPQQEPAKTPTNGAEDVESLKTRLAYLESEKSSANKEAQGLRKRLRELEAAQQAAEQKAMAEKGQFKELAEQRQKELEVLRQELEPLRVFKSTAEQREAEEQARKAAQVDAEFAQLPEEWRSLAPADASLREKQLAINACRRASGARPAPPMPPTAPRPPTGSTDGPKDIKDEEFIELNNPLTLKTRREELAKQHQAFLDWKSQQP